MENENWATQNAVETPQVTQETDETFAKTFGILPEDVPAAKEILDRISNNASLAYDYFKPLKEKKRAFDAGLTIEEYREKLQQDTLTKNVSLIENERKERAEIEEQLVEQENRQRDVLIQENEQRLKAYDDYVQKKRDQRQAFEKEVQEEEDAAFIKTSAV
jgi:hypothetical protein